MKQMGLSLGLVLMILMAVAPARAQEATDLHAQAVKESLKPIRPGTPGKAPFWNEQAKQFIFAPAFDFKVIQGAKSYRFTVAGADGKTLTFDAAEPWAALTPVWEKTPVGTTKVTVEGLDAAGQVIGAAGTRTFHRGAVFNGPYGQPVLPYGESAKVGLQSVMSESFVRAWRTMGRPDPAYPLYRYPSKLIGGVMSGCAMYAMQTPRPADADVALEIGRRAAEFLRSISGAPGSPMAFFPPSYHDAKPTERENDNWTMLFSGAEAGQGYLDLYDATNAPEHLEAAKRIAAAYGKLQLETGTWHLKVDNTTGQPVSDLKLIPSTVIRFLDRLVNQYRGVEFQSPLDRAVRWMMENPVRTFDWQAQFDDAKLRGPYQNLSKHEACEFASYLFERERDDPAKIELARELLRYAEDQFLVWEQPPADLKVRSDNLKPANWFTPCSMEQYAMFEPISGSSAFMIIAYIRAYQASGDKLCLAKAESLANALTAAQAFHHGRYPTRMVREDLAYWVNSTVNTVRAMKLLEAQAPRQNFAP